MIPAAVQDELSACLGEAVAFDVPMARHTSLRVGGPADAFATPESREQLSQLLDVIHLHDLPVTLIGSGFNTLVSDGGLDGVAICLKKLRQIERVDDQHLRAEAGVSHSQVTNYCLEHELSGLEFTAGIPGTVGGWVAMNAGIGEREIVHVVREVEVMGPGAAAIRTLRNGQLRFEYRSFASLPAGAVIVSALFEVMLSDRASVQAEVDRLLASRAQSQPLNVPSCGSVFKNPAGDFAGRLIEAAGLKGTAEGGAQISPTHANFIANIGGATAADVRTLIRRAQAEVERSSGVRLCPEVRIIGREA